MMKLHFKVKHASLLLLVMIVALVTGCKKVSYHQLSDEDMTWLVYKNNEIVRFSNTNGDNVAYLVTLRTKSYKKTDDKYNEFTTASFQQLNDTTAIFPDDSKGLLYIAKQDDDGLLVTLTWPHFPLKGVPLTGTFPGQATIGGINYNDIYVIDATGMTDLRFYISKIWYSKSYGLVQYEDAMGETWIKNI